MIEGLGLVVRGLHDAAALVGFGTLFCINLSARQDRIALASWRKQWLRVALMLSIACLFLGMGVLALQVTRIESEATWPALVHQLLLESRFGVVWILRQMLDLAACALLAAALGDSSGALPALALVTRAAGLAIAPLAGHSAAAEPAWPGLIAQAAHLLAAGAWWGALPALTAILLGSIAAAEPAVAARALRRFSAWAPWLMLLIIASGTWLAIAQVERWPALLATRYGHLLMLKVSLLVIVLSMAGRLRWRLLPALLREDSKQITRRSGHWVLAECGVAAGIVLAASQLAQTVPARHDAIDWWLPVRLSIDATWDLPWTPARAWAGIALTIGALVLVALASRGRIRRGRGLFAALVLATSAGVIALPALSVEAYPDTYRKATVSYHAISVAAGADLFFAHCTSCHGTSGHGDGAQARGLSPRPVDLTEPHTALHTAGDIFWWLTHGKPPGVMPGFADRLSEDDRWDLINFLRTLSAGYQARILTDRIVPGRPWLGAVDFSFSTETLAAGTLKDFRGRSAVVLVFFAWPQSRDRLLELARDYEQLHAAGADVVAIPVGGFSSDAHENVRLPFPVATEGAPETVRTYALLRRTLANADAQDQVPVPRHMELLVDRYGYIRARWLPSESDGWSRPGSLLAQLELLAREGRIRAPPEDHVH